jgi:RNA polymerase sigma-70 factor (ECF subfamily)
VSDDAEAAMRAACAAGRHDEATTLALRSYGQELLEYLIATARSDTAGSDAFSLFAERLWKKMPQFRWEASARTWSYMLARHALAELQRAAPARRAARQQPLSQTPEVAALVHDVRTRTLTFLRTAARDALAEVRDSLDPEDRELLILRIDRGLAWRDVARITSDGDDLDAAALTRRSAALRKRFEKLKDRLRAAVTRSARP